MHAFHIKFYEQYFLIKIQQNEKKKSTYSYKKPSSINIKTKKMTFYYEIFFLQLIGSSTNEITTTTTTTSTLKRDEIFVRESCYACTALYPNYSKNNKFILSSRVNYTSTQFEKLKNKTIFLHSILDR